MADSEKATPPEAQTTQPGQVIAPGQQVQQQPVPAQQEPPAQSFQVEPQNDFAPSYTAAEDVSEGPTEDNVTWTASEFISHEKDAGWYAKLALASVLLTILIFILTKDKVTAGIILFVSVVLGFYANREPRQLPYRVDGQGVQIGERRYGYEQFRSFSVMPEGAFSCIVLMPLKRFAPIISLYYAPEDEERITTLLAKTLPFEERTHDPVDKFMQRIRF